MKLRILFAAMLLLPLALLKAGPAEDASGVAAVNSLKVMDDNPLHGVQYVVSEDWNGSTYLFRKVLPDTKQVHVTLLMIGGIPSSEKGVRMFGEKRNIYASDAPDKRHQDDPTNLWINTSHLADLVEPGSLQFYRRDDAQVFYSFKSKTSIEGKPVELEGELVYNEKMKCVTMIQVATQTEFKLSHSRRISSFSWQMSFTRDENLKLVVPTATSWSVVGKKGFSSDYTDYYQAKMNNFDLL
jgi:hypothetical protein